MSNTRKQPATDAICVLCGAAPASTGQGDHIPPKSIYTKPERQAATWQFHTVPACIKCNGSGAKHDEALKVMMGFASGESRDIPDDVIDTIAATIGKNQRLAKQIFSSATFEGSHVKVTFDEESYKEGMTRIVKAMYWSITNEILSASAKIDVIPDQRLEPQILKDLDELPALFPTKVINGGTFKCKLIGAKSAEMIVLNFFDKHTVIAVIYKNDSLK